MFVVIVINMIILSDNYFSNVSINDIRGSIEEMTEIHQHSIRVKVNAWKDPAVSSASSAASWHQLLIGIWSKLALH